MTRATYQRRDWGRLVWGVVIALALGVALYIAGRATVRAIQEQERRAVLAEGDTLAKLALARGDSLRRVVDSLRIVTAHRDTIVVHTIERAKAETAKPLPPASDTAALVAAVRSCRATLDTLVTDCTRYRETATAALEAAKQQHEADSTRDAIRAQQLAAITRSRDAALTQIASRGRWHSFERGVCVASLATNYLQWRSR
ncbi:hypothetical protein [Gemmatimonas sp.]